MIDWLSAILPVGNVINGGVVVKLSSEGEVENEKLLPLGVPGSWSSDVMVCNVWADRARRGDPVPPSCAVIATSVYISGNPAKYLQGHNVYGTDNLNQLAALFFETVAVNLGLSKDIQDLWYQIGLTGRYEPTRIDITYNYRVEGGSESVNTWLRAAHNSSRVSHKHAGVMKGNTLYFGQHSRRHTIKMYNKFEDLLVHKPCALLRDIVLHKGDGYVEKSELIVTEGLGGERLSSLELLQANGSSFNTIMNRIYDDADGLLRVEQTFRAKKLRDLGFGLARGLDEMAIRQLFNDGMKTFSLTAQVENSGITKDVVGRGAYAYYTAWLAGALDCATEKRTTIHYNRKKLLPYGVDITLPRSTTNDVVYIPLIRTIEAIPVVAPSFYREYGLLAAA